MKRNSPHLYIANQMTGEGLDEIQRLLLAYQLSLPVALDGPPGVGKTQCVLELSRLLGKTLYTRTCSSRTTETQIIAHPMLVARNSASVTEYINGPLGRALEEGALFYGDEFNLLKEDVQKRLNSAFDERRTIDRADGLQISAKKGFFGIISYNPSDNLISRDLESSVADRFIHFHYHRWSPDFKAYVAHLKAQGKKSVRGLARENPFQLDLQWRGLTSHFQFILSRGEEGGPWVDFFSGEEVREKPAYLYLTLKQKNLLEQRENVRKKLEGMAYSEINLGRILARFTDALSAMARGENTPLLKKIGIEDIKKREDMELLSLHEASARIEAAAMRHYADLLRRGCPRYAAQSYAVHLVIDQVCYGQYRHKKLRESTVYEIVTMVARNMGLLMDGSRYNTQFFSKKILGEADD